MYENFKGIITLSSVNVNKAKKVLDNIKSEYTHNHNEFIFDDHNAYYKALYILDNNRLQYLTEVNKTIDELVDRVRTNDIVMMDLKSWYENNPHLNWSDDDIQYIDNLKKQNNYILNMKLPLD